MSPPNARSRPGGEAAHFSQTTSTRPELKPVLMVRQGSDEKRRACRHVRVRFCPSCVVERRRASDELNVLLPHQPRVPCTFGLSPRELRAHARELRLAGWTNGELRQVLDLTHLLTPQDGAQ
jgi:hypothetical protein